MCCILFIAFLWTPSFLAQIYQTLKFFFLEIGVLHNMVLRAYFDLLKPKSDIIPGELDETTTGYNQTGQEPQETTVDKGCMLLSILQHPTGKGSRTSDFDQENIAEGSGTTTFCINLQGQTRQTQLHIK